jgi:hypothetical protein
MSSAIYDKVVNFGGYDYAVCVGIGRKIWETYKNIAAGRGLLQWIGWWPWAVAAMTTSLTWLWAWLENLAGPEQFVLALGAFAAVLGVIVFIRLAYLTFVTKPISATDATASTSEEAIVGLQKVGSLGTIIFDYIPTSPLEAPLERRWTKAYKPDGEAAWGTDHDIDGSLRMEVKRSEFAMDYVVPVHATRANRLQFTAKYNNSADPSIATMIFAHVEVSPKSGEPRRRGVKIYFGDKHAFETPGNIWYDPAKQLPEQTLYWPARPLGNGRLEFNIDLHEAVKIVLGAQGWIYRGVCKIRLRGNLSISPIEFAN